MNTRIRELKHQASVWCDENIPEQFSEETNGYGSAWEDKFAELIIQECAGVCESMPLLGPYKEVQDATLKDAAAQIKEHFGVEERRGWACPKCGVDRTKDVCPQGHMAAVEGKCPMIGVAQ